MLVNWSDRTGGRAFDHHSRNGGQGILPTKIARRAGHWTNWTKFARANRAKQKL